ncbi:chorismate mutase [Loktanella sp. TSTF-M6]|uniref:chorismate mutase n=1 Tax=Loktanella gaetbuli TaxID=2881335 RepID=A0ABS8BVV0_9RHOB|nr:chorismate mutase [Loktanella gaetbuli]MCB5199863.1 chorismate mutase [Loktanella gaetbuli]
MPASKAPADCTNMAELREQIDALDTALIDLLAQRVGYIDRAVDLKKVEGLPARTVDRVAEVKARVRALADARDLDPDLAEALWHTLIEWSIAREAVHLG